MQNLMYKLLTVSTAIAALTFSAPAQTVEATISLPGSNFGGIVANPVTHSVYAVSRSGSATDADTVTVIDGKTDKIVASIPVPAGAYLPAVDIVTNKIYVASCDDLLNPTPCFVTVIDGKQNTVVTSVPVSTVLNGFLAGIAVNPFTHTIYVSDNTNGDVAIIDGATNTLTGTISLPGVSPWGMAIDAFRGDLYVTTGGSLLTVINTKTQSQTQIPVSDGALIFNAAVDPITGHVFVTDTQSGPSAVTVLDQSGRILATVPVGKAPYGVDVDPLTHLAFVANVGDNSTSVFRTRHNEPRSVIENSFAVFLSVDPLSRKVYGAGNGVVTVAREGRRSSDDDLINSK